MSEMQMLMSNDRCDTSLYLIAIVMSFLLSFWVNVSETVINSDGICYLLSAEAIAHSGIKGAMHLCGQAKWPFYSILIYGLSHITHLSYLISANLLNSVFSSITVFAFILIIQQLGANRRTLWMAAAIILLAHQFNSVRESIIRDHGFWAFYLSSLYFLLRYVASPDFFKALAFGASLLIATLFRIEALIFLLLLPWLTWFDTRYSLAQRAISFLTLSFLLLIIGTIVFGWLLVHQQNLDQLSRVSELLHQFQYGIFTMGERYTQMKIGLAQYVLPQDSAHDAGLILAVMMLGWYSLSIMSNISWIYIVLVFYAWFRHVLFLEKPVKRVLMSYIIINLLITFGFLMQHAFLSNRYLIALSLVLMLWVPFALNDLVERANTWRARFVIALIAFLILLFSLGGIFDFGYSKSYISESGGWLAKNVPPYASLYANDFQLMYYSNHFGNHIFTKARDYVQLDVIKDEKWKQYDYLALRLSHRESNKALKKFAEMKMKPVEVFSNKRGDRVEVYKINK